MLQVREPQLRAVAGRLDSSRGGVAPLHSMAGLGLPALLGRPALGLGLGELLGQRIEHVFAVIIADPRAAEKLRTDHATSYLMNERVEADSFYDGATAKTPIKSLPLLPTERVAAGASLLQAVVALKRCFQKVFPSQDVRLVIEVSRLSSGVCFPMCCSSPM